MAAAACVAASGKTAARVACEVASAIAAAWLAQPDAMAPTRTRAPRPHSPPWMARDRFMGLVARLIFLTSTRREQSSRPAKTRLRRLRFQHDGCVATALLKDAGSCDCWRRLA